MKILIVGTGIIGTTYGWALARAGTDVTHLVRPGTARPPGALVLDVLDERAGHPTSARDTYEPATVDDLTPADGYELVIVPTAAHQLHAALEQVVPRAGDALFLPFTGLWEGTDGIDRLLPRDRYLLGYPDGGGTVVEDTYWVNLGAEVHLGMPEGGAPDRLARVVALFEAADMRPDVQDDMIHWLWQHIASTVGFSAGFAKHRALDPYLADKRLLNDCIRSTTELYALCERRGVVLKNYPEASFRHWPVRLVRAFITWNFRHNASMQRYTAHAAGEGNLREARHYYDHLMGTAGELGVDLPHTRALGRFLPAADGTPRPA